MSDTVETNIVRYDTLRPGDRITQYAWGEGPTAEILREAEHTTETVGPLYGQPISRLWARREDTGAEGYISYGEGGVCNLVSRAS